MTHFIRPSPQRPADQPQLSSTSPPSSRSPRPSLPRRAPRGTPAPVRGLKDRSCLEERVRVGEGMGDRWGWEMPTRILSYDLSYEPYWGSKIVDKLYAYRL